MPRHQENFKILPNAKSVGEQSKQLSTKSKNQFKDECLTWCVEDLRPFSIISGEAFERVIQKAINIGAEHGPVEARAVIPDRRAIGKNVASKAALAREQLKPLVRKYVQGGFVGATTDMWTEPYTAVHYLTVTFHIVINGKLVSFVYKPFPA